MPERDSDSTVLAKQLLDTVDVLKDLRDHDCNWQPREELVYAHRIRAIWQEED